MPVSVSNASIQLPQAPRALAHARDIFLSGSGLALRWADTERFVILETGFGAGLGFLAAWHAWRVDVHRPRRLHFVSVDSVLPSRADVVHYLAPFGELQPLASAITAVWPPPLAGFHRLHFDGGNVILTLMLGEAHAMLRQLVAQVDAFFLDGFSPAKTVGIWSPDVTREFARLAAPGATFATPTAAGGVRAVLAGAGFRVEKRDAVGDAPEMLVGTFEPRVEVPARQGKHAVIVGGGLAGTLAAERLAARDWDVQLVDAQPERSVAAVGLVRPIANLRDAVNAQVSRSAFLYALQHYRGLQHDGYHLMWDRCGVLQLATDADEAARFAAIVQSQGHPPEFLEYVASTRAAALAGREVRAGGWWFPTGAWVSPESLAIATLAKAGARVRSIRGQHVERVQRTSNNWQVLDRAGKVIAESATLVLANAVDAKRLFPEGRLGLSSVRGQVTYLPHGVERGLERIVSGSGYIAPMPGGGHCIGATYQHDDIDEAVRATDHRENLLRAETMLPGFTRDIHPRELQGWTGFRTTVPDRLPVFGASAVEGLHLATGLGSRGLLWAPLGAELLASQLEGEPLPLSRDHAGAISPRRFLS